MAKPTFFTERKEFIGRMVAEPFHKKLSWGLEQKVAKEIFQKYPLEFLAVVRPPFEMHSIVFFQGESGKKYLEDKYREFKYKPEKSEKIIEFKEKAGEDFQPKKRLTFRDFMKE